MQDYAAIALNVLPPGQNGSLVFNRNTRDQAQLYECLTPLFDRVQAEDLRQCFKDASLGMNGKPARVQRPRKGVVIERDRWGVPHITGKTAADVAFGAGWVTVEDRGLLLDLIRGPARAAALDIPGISPVELALSGKQFVPSAQGEAELSRQLGLVRKAGARGKRLLTVVQAYVAGLNASLKKRGLLFNPYTTRDVVAVAALLTARFGANGGSEIRRAMFLDALQKKLGKATGRAVFDDLRAADDGEAPTIGPGRFAYQLPPAAAPGSVVIDDGSFQPLPIPGGTVVAGEPRSVERAARRREAIEDRPPDPRRRAAGGLLLPAVLHGGRPPWGRVRRSWRAASRTAVRRHRPRPRLRLDSDVVAGRQHRRLRREPVRRRPPLSPSGQLPRDDEPRRGHPAIDRHARPAAEPAADGAWRRAWLRDGRRDARRAVAEALHEGP